MSYVPGMARYGEPTPQTDPDLFDDNEIRAEIDYLLSIDKRYGDHPLRAAARLRLFGELVHRRDVRSRQEGGAR